MPNEVKLMAIEPAPALAVLVQGLAGPVFRGADPNGSRYVCGVCSTSVLAERVAEGDLYDIAFRCGRCGGLSMGPRLPPGRPLPWQRTVAIRPGDHPIASTIQGRDGVVLAAQEAVARALWEIGTRIGTDGGRKTELNAEFLDSLVARSKTLLGNAYARLAATYEQGRRSRTPPRFPHRLMHLTTAADAASESFRKGGLFVFEPVATVELLGMIEQLDRWRNHPSWPGLLPSLESPQDFPHVLITLAAASFLSDVGNDVELVPAGDRRSPDLRLHVGARSVVSTEVKAPITLQRPAAPLDQSTARAIVGRAFKRAGSGSRGQLAPGADALFILGGYSLRKADLDTLEAAARDLFRHYRKERQHVLGIVIVSLGALIDSRPDGTGHTLPTLNGTLGVRVITNENYSGPNRISQEKRPGLEPLRGLQEIELRPGGAE